MKKKTKIILAVVAVILVVLGFAAYEVGSLFYPLKYKNDYTAQTTQITSEEKEELNSLYDTIDTYYDTLPFAAVHSRESYTVENYVLPDGVSSEDINEEIFESLGLINEENKAMHPQGYTIDAISILQNSLYEISDYEIKENKNGSKNYTIKICDEMCYYTGFALYKVVPYVSTTFSNIFVYGLYTPSDAAVKAFTPFSLEDVDILFPGTTINISTDNEGRITNFSAEIPVKFEARVVSELSGKETVTLEATKYINHDISYV